MPPITFEMGEANMPKADCLVIIPAYNEEENIGKVLKDIRSLNIALDIVVVNDGSTDNTRHVVREAGEKAINLPYNLGYGAALQTGFKYAALKGYEYVVQFDADGQHDPGDVLNILHLLRAGGCDIVIGSRFLGKGSFKAGVLKRIAISVFRFIIRAATGVKITDPTSGLQGLSKRAYNYYAVTGNYPEDFPDADTLINMILSNYRVREIPADVKDRYSGKSMHTGYKTIFYFFKMLVSILVVLLRKKTKAECS
ncbi:MAG TPA: glycosyltransferase family 2 protein [Bacillota bacterium]|nr:glycosyltransferase family 2 protein [Bacillota bacterium]